MFGSLGACGRRILRSVGRGEHVHCVRCQIFNLSACRETTTERFNGESDAASLCDRLDYVIMGCASLHDVIRMCSNYSELSLNACLGTESVKACI